MYVRSMYPATPKANSAHMARAVSRGKNHGSSANNGRYRMTTHASPSASATPAASHHAQAARSSTRSIAQPSPHTTGIAKITAPITSSGVCTPNTSRDAAISPIQTSAATHTHQRRAAAASPPNNSAVVAVWPLGKE